MADEDLQASVDRQIRSVTGGAKAKAAASAPSGDVSELESKIDSKIDKVYDAVVLQIKNNKV